MEGKRQGYLYTQTLFWSLQLFCSVECLPEPIEIVASPRKGIEKYYRIIFDHRMFSGYV